MDTLTKGAYVKPGIYAYRGEKETKAEDENAVEQVVKKYIFKGKSRGVGLRSVLGEDKPDEKRDIQKEWFDYLDELAEDCYGKGRDIAVVPHKKLVTFGLAASNPELWPMCGNWIEDTRVFKMNDAGVKRI